MQIVALKTIAIKITNHIDKSVKKQILKKHQRYALPIGIANELIESGMIKRVVNFEPDKKDRKIEVKSIKIKPEKSQ